MSSSLWGPPKAPQGTSKGERGRVLVYECVRVGVYGFTPDLGSLGHSMSRMYSYPTITKIYQAWDYKIPVG